MAIYEDVIDEKILTLQAKIAGKYKEIDDITVIISGLHEIKKEGDAPVMDKLIGAEMTEERRQVIYDTCIAKAEEVLGD